MTILALSGTAGQGCWAAGTRFLCRQLACLLTCNVYNFTPARAFPLASSILFVEIRATFWRPAKVDLFTRLLTLGYSTLASPYSLTALFAIWSFGGEEAACLKPVIWPFLSQFVASYLCMIGIGLCSSVSKKSLCHP
ncbi:hypothetical protein CTAM01_03171 [Colletotrichum tamarilloi]|uniref:Integral membrane protein n=1 Tax=Colletotrichum tamarilloi TaxID=1209934 RepID=A0ABQ9RL94_9PEZI|nr:uncharacterized protein CTAM01_03171 [Colletotrichum tamarilloi]KAK1506839.1 hypothetical protein CTAM01_03171 [Colletotrichum tamarilloi]